MSGITRAPVGDDTLTDAEATAAAYGRWVERTGLADATKRAYTAEVARFATWLTNSDKHQPADVFTDPHARDYAARDYRRWMLTEKKRAPKGVDLALTAMASMFGWVGLGRPDVALVAGRNRSAPKALDEDQVRDVMRAAERRGVRDHALVASALGTGLRVSELAALDVDDVWVSDRRGAVQVRAGKGDRPRTVPLPALARGPLAVWLRERGSERPGAPLWTTAGQTRLAVRSVRYVVTECGTAAGVHLSPHVLRHTFGTILVRDGADLVTVADLMGHQSVDTTRIYARPTLEDAAAAVERVRIDY